MQGLAAARMAWRILWVQVTHPFRSKCEIELDNVELPVMLLATQKRFENGPQVILASRAAMRSPAWLYAPKGNYFVYRIPLDKTVSRYDHYKSVYADPDSAIFIGEFVSK